MPCIYSFCRLLYSLFVAEVIVLYDIITDIIGHNWVSNYSGDQQYIYYIAGAVICILVVVFVDFIKDIFSGFFRGEYII